MQNQRRTLICKRCGEHIDIRRRRSDGSLQCPKCRMIYRPRSTQTQQQSPMRKPQKRKKPVKLIIGFAVLLLLLIILVGSCGNKEKDVAPVQTQQPIEEINTTAKVDQLIAQAKADAESADGLALASDAWNWIVTFVPEWYSSNAVMEEAIYNGALVEYYFTDKDEVRAQVGMDTVQAVKYVYRGVETESDYETKENIRQIKEGIERASLPDGYPYLKFGELLDFKETPTYLFDENDQFIGTEDNIVVVKAKISPSYNNEATIKQNYLNIEDLIKNQGFDKYNELQYWAVADMTDGSEGKVFSCTVDEVHIHMIKNSSVATVDGYDVYLKDDLWILPSLLE